MRYKSFGRNDDQVTRDGDPAFLGFVSRLDPGIIDPNYASGAENMRFDRGVATTRKGTQLMTTGSTAPFYAAAMVTNSVGTNFILQAGGSSTSGWDSTDILQLPATLPFTLGTGAVTNTYPVGETVAEGDNPFIVQANNSIFIFRGFNKDPLEIAGTSSGIDLSSNSVTVNTTIPNSTMGVYVGKRLVVIKDRYTIAMSNSGASGLATWQTINEFPINLGDNDPIVAIAPYAEDQLLIFKTRSVFVMTNISTLDESVIQEVTRQHGLAARDSIAQVGDQVFYLSTSGISAITNSVGAGGSSIRILKVVDDPLSAPIDDLVDKINYTTAATKAVGVYYDNKYILALPMTDRAGHTEGNNSLLQYNMLNKAWESRDHYPVNPDMLVTAMFGDQMRLMMGNKTGTLLLCEQGDTDYNPSGSGTIAGKLTTRAYQHNTFGDVKKYRSGVFNWATINDASSTVSYVPTAYDPDSSLSSRTASTTTANESVHTPFSLGRLRGQRIQVEFNTSGRVEIKNVWVHGSSAGRHEFQTS